MSRFRKYLKREMDVDYLACVHGMSLVFVYGCLLYFTGHKELSFVTIFQMFLMGYLIAWTQKLLFWEERKEKKAEFWIKAVLWCVLPNIECFIAARIFHWFWTEKIWIEPVTYFIMLGYYIMVFGSIQLLYRDDTKEMNDLLEEYKRRGETNEGNH